MLDKSNHEISIRDTAGLPDFGDAAQPLNDEISKKDEIGKYEDFEDAHTSDTKDDSYVMKVLSSTDKDFGKDKDLKGDEDFDEDEDFKDPDFEDDDELEDLVDDDDDDELEDLVDDDDDDEEDELEDLIDDEDELDDEDFEEEDDEDDDDDEELEAQLNPGSFFDQLSSNPLFAQVSQMLTGGMSGIEKSFTEARMLQATGDLEGAAQLYLDVLEEDPEHFKANEALGQVLMAMDKPQDAQLYLQKAVEIDPEDPSGHLYLGYAYYAQQDLAKASEAFQQAVALEPDNLIARNNLGFMQYLSGDLEAAAQAFTTAGDYGSDRAFYNLGMVRLLQGHAKNGWNAYQEAFDLDPRMQQIEDHLQDLDTAIEKYPDRADLLKEAVSRLEARLNGDDDE